MTFIINNGESSLLWYLISTWRKHLSGAWSLLRSWGAAAYKSAAAFTLLVVSLVGVSSTGSKEPQLLELFD